MLVVPVLVVFYLPVYASYESCVGKYGPASTGRVDGVAGPCYGATMLTGAIVIALYAIALVTGVVGFVLGIVDGRARHRFACGRWICVVVVGLTGPWALLAYAFAFGLGRLLPPRRAAQPRQSDVALRQGWQEAIHLYQRLARGEGPPSVIAPGFLGPGAIHMDAPLLYSRFYGTTVTYGQSWTYAYGSPAVVTGALIGNVIGNSIAKTRAANLARPQWREFAYARVVVTPLTTWCCIDGRWLAFDHEAALEYVIDGPACILTFAGVEPLRLSGPSAWCHAVLYAYCRYGPSGWQQAPFLHPLREAVLSSTKAADSAMTASDNA
ncbi:hypothetical protein AB0J86_09500 [Micromonospora sp. NPDC049559]|uniref:hypothetical protein n=1 Tax=Micromonospora sp. NPDC049559 TaxID=3155923 RepID=UPI003433C3A1